MLKLLTTLAGAQLAATLKGRVEHAVHAAIWAAVAGVLGLIGLVFLLVALTIVLTPELGPAGAVAAVGAAVIALAIGAYFIGRIRPRRRATLGTGFASMAGAGVGASMAADDGPPPPRRPLVGAPVVVAGALGAMLVGLILGRRL